MTTLQHNCIKQLNKNNYHAFKKLFLEQYKPVCYYINEIIANVEISKDLAQDVFESIWKNRKKLDPNKEINSLLFVTAKNKAFDFIRKNNSKNKYSKYIIDNSNNEFTQEDLLEIEELEGIIKNTIATFSSKTKEIYKLRKEEFKKINEISAITGMPRQTINWHLTKIKKELINALNKYYE
jgi:RNA polymerase sigma-70 factor (ECF subfamily)